MNWSRNVCGFFLAALVFSCFIFGHGPATIPHFSSRENWRMGFNQGRKHRHSSPRSQLSQSDFDWRFKIPSLPRANISTRKKAFLLKALQTDQKEKWKLNMFEFAFHLRIWINARVCARALLDLVRCLWMRGTMMCAKKKMKDGKIEGRNKSSFSVYLPCIRLLLHSF